MSMRFGMGLNPSATTATATTTTQTTQQNASSVVITPPQKLPFEQLDANTRQLIEAVQKLFLERNLADEISRKSTEPITRVTEDSQLLIEKLETLLGTVNQDNQEALALKKEYTSLLRNVDQLSSLVERAGILGTAVESRQAAVWDNYQLANLPSKYFRDLVGAFESRMLEYRQTIETIEKFVETSSSIKVYTPAMLKEVMQAQMEYFMTLTAQVAQLHDALQDLQEKLNDSLKEKYGDSAPVLFVDPYAPKVKKEKTVPQLSYVYAQPEPQQPTQPQAGTTAAGFGTPKTGFGTGTSFGAGAAKTGFGATSTTGGFGAGAAKTGFGATSTTGGFGAGAAKTGFGATSTTGGFGAGAAKTTTGGFGAGAAKTGFGATTPKTGGFGTTGSSFGTPKTGGFGTGGTAGGFGSTGAKFGFNKG